MQDFIVIFDSSPGFVKLLLLLATNVIFNAIGLIPSAFLTAINLSLYGTLLGFFLSLLGEVIGTQFGFHLYRMGISKISPTWKTHRYWGKIHSSSVQVVFIWVILFRLLPFVPSGLVTAGAAFTSISLGTFLTASTIGKIPSVLIEVTIINGVTEYFNLSIHTIILIFLCLVVLTLLFRKGKIFLK